MQQDQSPVGHRVQIRLNLKIALKSEPPVLLCNLFLHQSDQKLIGLIFPFHIQEKSRTNNSIINLFLLTIGFEGDLNPQTLQFY